MKKFAKTAAAATAAVLVFTNTAAAQTYPDRDCTDTYNDIIMEICEEESETGIFDFLPLWNNSSHQHGQNQTDIPSGAESAAQPEGPQLPSLKPGGSHEETTERQTETVTKETHETTTKAPAETTTEATTEAAKETTKAAASPAAEATTKASAVTTTETTTKAAVETTTEATTSAFSGSASSADTSMAARILQLVNEERAAAGLSSLTLDSSLNNAAALKAQDMADNNYFSHTSPTYGTPFQMLSALGISYKSAGENIAKGQKSAEAVMTAWMNSEGHKANILSSNYGKLGVGYVNQNGTTYWVQIFTD